MKTSTLATILAVVIGGAMAVEMRADDFAALPREDENSRIAHAQLLEKSRSGEIDLYFLGDSITRRWGCTDAAYQDLMENWREHFFGWNAANFGWGGDTTHNVLWRLENGELEGVGPRVIVLQAGTNDLGGRRYDGAEAAAKVDEVALGIETLVARCLELAPDATVIVTGVFPRGDNPSVNPMIEAINERIAKLAGRERVRYLNINDRLSDDSGAPAEGMTVDGLHLSARGYNVWAEALEPHLRELLGPRAEEDHAPPPTGNPAASP